MFILLLLFAGFLMTIGLISIIASGPKINRLKEDYNEALASADRARALEAGRKYYAAKRYGSPLKAADEQAITNDIMAMPKEPRPFQRKIKLKPQKSGKEVPTYVWIGGGIVALMAIVTLLKEADSGTPEVSKEVQDEVKALENHKSPYEVLDYDLIGDGKYQNLNVLIKDTVIKDSKLPDFAYLVSQIECRSTKCNTIDLWTTKEAYDLHKAKQDSPKWRKKYWPKICEANVAFYVASVGEVVLYPLIDSEYRRWGGKKKRPKPSVYKNF